MKTITILVSTLLLFCTLIQGAEKKELRPFLPEKDLISLHYDHAPDKDDGHSAAADRTILESIYGAEWISNHVVAVSGAYGTNKKQFNVKSDAVMDAVWNDRGGWIPAHRDRSAALDAIFDRWLTTLKSGGDVYVKEGGQSDITSDLIKRLRELNPDIDPLKRIHVVQHSNWNENYTTPEALAYTKENTDYIRIGDANKYLNRKGGDLAFAKAAGAHPVFKNAWIAAFEYYQPEKRLDFSDSGELMHILGIGELNIDDFRKRFLEEK